MIINSDVEQLSEFDNDVIIISSNKNIPPYIPK